jgi:hypothetical protein
MRNELEGEMNLRKAQLTGTILPAVCPRLQYHGYLTPQDCILSNLKPTQILPNPLDQKVFTIFPPRAIFFQLKSA